MLVELAPKPRDLESLKNRYWNASAQVCWARVEDRDAVQQDALARSYLLTITATEQGRIPGKSLTNGFSCTNSGGRLEMQFRGARIPISSECIRDHLLAFGAEVLPGEWLMMDAGLVRAVVTKAMEWSDERQLREILAVTHEMLARRKKRSIEPSTE